VVDAAKQYALDQRRGLATATKNAIFGWKTQQGKNTADHLKQARANRDLAQLSRANAKQLREQIVRERQREAAAARDARKANKLSRDPQAAAQPPRRGSRQSTERARVARDRERARAPAVASRHSCARTARASSEW
jgi:hypothetical protein